jgi:hypothetical protein
MTDLASPTFITGECTFWVIARRRRLLTGSEDTAHETGNIPQPRPELPHQRSNTLSEFQLLVD